MHTIASVPADSVAVVIVRATLGRKEVVIEVASEARRLKVVAVGFAAGCDFAA